MVNLTNNLTQQLKLEQHLTTEWQEKLSSHTAITVGLSGGVDSVVMLHLLHKLSRVNKFKLDAIHVNHGLSANAAAWEDFCKSLCDKLAVPLKVYQCKITKSGGESLENNARKARYQFLLSSNSHIVVLAHHQDDQAETIISQLLRGSNLRNIAGMKPISYKQDKLIWRPLLSFSKAIIWQYAAEHNLEFIEDESNYQQKYLRNFIRHKLIPDIVEWDANVVHKILGVGQQLQQATALIDQLAIDDFNQTSSDKQDSLYVDKFVQLSNLRQANLISYFIKLHNLALPSTKQTQEFCHQVQTSKWDRQPKLNLSGNYVIIKSRNLIYIEAINPTTATTN